MGSPWATHTLPQSPWSLLGVSYPQGFVLLFKWPSCCTQLRCHLPRATCQAISYCHPSKVEHLPGTDPPLVTEQSRANWTDTRPGHMSAEGTCREEASKVGRNSRTQQYRPKKSAKALKWNQLGSSGVRQDSFPFESAWVPAQIHRCFGTQRGSTPSHPRSALNSRGQ